MVVREREGIAQRGRRRREEKGRAEREKGRQREREQRGEKFCFKLYASKKCLKT